MPGRIQSNGRQSFPLSCGLRHQFASCPPRSCLPILRLGGPEKLEAGLADVRAMLEEADPEFVKAMAPALNSSAVALQLIQHAERLVWRASPKLL
jgi:hypothetical protein